MIARLPILWLFVGPPVFRLAERSAAASLEGSIDSWNLLRIAWWAFVGFVALIHIYRARAHVRPFISRLGSLSWLTGTLLLSLMVSASYSPSPLLTISHAAMLAILVLTAFDLGLKIFMGKVSLDTVLKGIFLASVALLAIASITFAVAPQIVGWNGGSGFPRVRGGTVADIALLSQIVFFVGYYLATRARGLQAGLYSAAVIVSPAFLLLAQTRAMYVSFFVGSLVFLYLALRVFGRQHRLALLGLMSMLAACLCMLWLFEDLSRTPHGPLAQAEEFLVRDRASIAGLNSRTGLTRFLIARVTTRPWGLGYSAGPRAALLSSADELLRYGIYEAFAGTAHSMYLEFLAGSGVVGIVSFLSVLFIVGRRAIQIAEITRLPLVALLVVVLVGGITESSGALPFTQASALLWILAACTAAPALAGDRVVRQDVGLVRESARR